MILLADAGATKTDWALIEGSESSVTQTEGINPYFTNKDFIHNSLSENSRLSEAKSKVESVFFYGAGCSDKENNQYLKDSLKSFFSNSKILVYSDILGAARALFHNKPGIVCILGTGSNCCKYNGKKITHSVPSLGFILGDEGSGAYLGKRLLQKYYHKELPVELMEKLNETYDLSRNKVLKQVYRESYPNRYLAGFTSFIYSNRNNKAINDIIEEGFKTFFENQVLKIKASEDERIRYTGSVAWYFQKTLEKISIEYNMKFNGVIRSPINELIYFHQKGTT